MSEKLFEAIGGIDGKFIDEQAQYFSRAQEPKAKRPRWFSSPAVRRLASVAAVALAVCTLSLGAAFGSTIKEFVRTILSDENGIVVDIGDIGTVKIKDTALHSEDFIEMAFSEAEEMLGVDILCPRNAASDRLMYRSSLSGNKIGCVSLYYADFMDYSEENAGLDEAAAAAKDNDEYQAISAKRKWIVMDVTFLTPDAGEGFRDAFQSGVDAGGQKSVENTYALENIGVDAAVYTYDWSETRLNATFVYHDMLYALHADNVSPDEMLDILASLE